MHGPSVVLALLPVFQAATEPATVADSLYFASRPAASLAECERGMSGGATDTALFWRAARAAIAVGMLSRGAERKASYETALVYARRGLSLSPNSVDARYWVAAAAGRRANRDDPLLSIRLAREAYTQVTAIL